MRAFLSLLLGLSLSGTLMALLLILLRRLLGHRLPSAFYYYAWLLVLLRFVLPLPGLLPGLGQAEARAPLPSVFSETADGATRHYNDAFYHAGSAGAEDKSGAENAVNVASVLPEEENSSASRALSAQRLFDLKQALRSERFWLSVWVIGMGVYAVWYLGGYLRFRRELSATLTPASPSDRAIYETVTDEPCPTLWRSKAVRTPMLLGIVRPIIVLPDRSYSDTMLQGILAHEMTHHRRRDVLYKWFSVLVSIVHWFNPVTRLFRYELDRACELACDERLLRHMDAGEKQLYGDMLITLAADRRLPRSVVATSFAVEKRNLKERLIQIMTYKKRGKASIALILAAMLLLSACGAVAGPGTAVSESREPAAVPNTLSAVSLSSDGRTETDSPLPADETGGKYTEVTVDNIDDFLDAIAPNTIIFLEPGTYDLSAAKTYGQVLAGRYYSWRDAYDGYELVIPGVDNLVIAGLPGESGGEILFSAIPRYAQVLRFENCSNLTLSAFTAGHTQEPGQCAGGVLYFDSCRNTHVTGCNLYGCGILGIQAVNCDTLFAESCAIYDCSVGAVSSRSSKDIRLIDCDIYNCGKKDGGIATSLFDVWTSTGFAVLNSYVHDNYAMDLLRTVSSDEVYLLGTEVTGNGFTSLFSSNLIAPIVGGSSFGGNSVKTTFDSNGLTGPNGVDYVLSPEGEELGRKELEGMTLDRFAYAYNGPVMKQAAAVTGIPVQDGMEYHVTTVDELLAAIGSDTTIYLDGELFDWSTASNYGGYGGEHYYWVDIFDGPSLVISNVSNLRIIGQGKDETTVQAVPRYADVIAFENCEHITVASLTAGHLKDEPGSCTGDVLAFEGCQDVHVVDCGLFGCGVFGIRANNCVQGDILRTEIYECSGGAVNMTWTTGFVFTDCSVHDCYSSWDGKVNCAFLTDCGDCSYNGAPLPNGTTDVGDSEAIAPHVSRELNAEAVPVPTPMPESAIHLFFFETEITPEKGGFTLHVGDAPITLTALIKTGDEYYAGADFEFYSSNDSKLRVTPGEGSNECTVEPLAAAENGVTLSVSCNGDELLIPVWIVP